MSLRNAKIADQWIKDVVSGYIRELEGIESIPKDIYYLCVLYYLLQEKFLIHGRLVDILSSDPNRNKDDIISKKKAMTWTDEHIHGWNTVYGDVVIDAVNNPNIIVKWTLKVDTQCCAIGIDASEFKMVHEFIAYHTNEAVHYTWYGYLGDIYCSFDNHNQDIEYYDIDKKHFKTGDIVKMELNVPNKQLIFIKNDYKNYIVLDEIITTEKYHLAVSVLFSTLKSGTNGTVQLIDFEITE